MNSSSSSRVEGERKYRNDQQSPTVSASIIKFLRIFAGDSGQISQLSDFWLVDEFQLGDDLVSYSLDGSMEDSNRFLYLIGEGKVRIVAFDPTLERQVSTQLLLAEQNFGTDHLLYHQPLSYQAIAATSGWVAKLPISILQQWLQEFSYLEELLHQTVSERQKLIFFKTQTELRSQTSRTLFQILPHLEKITINAGSSLSVITPPSQGRFWLIDGITTTSLQIGESWGYSDDTFLEGVATTDLSVYHLPSAYCEQTIIGVKNNNVSTLPTPLTSPALQPTLPAPIANANKLVPHEGLHTTKIENTSYRLPTPDSPLPIFNLENSETTTTKVEIPSTQTRHHRRLIPKLWHSYPFVQQQTNSDCGAACLAIISRYWGKRFSLNSLCRLARVDETGSSLAGLLTAATSLGYESLAVKGSLSELASLANPWIAHWQGIHYVVVWQVLENHVLISDPAIGKRSLTVKEFIDNWTGYALILEPTQQLDAQPNEKISLHGFWQGLQHYRYLIGQIVFASLLMQVFGVLAPLLTQIAIDHVLPDKNLVILNIFTVGFLCFGIWQISLKAVRQYLLDYFAQRMDISLLGGFVNHLLRLPWQFFISRPLGDIIGCAQENRKIQIFLTRQAVSMSLDLVMTIICVGLLTYYNWQLTLFLLIIILAIACLSVAVSPLRKRVLRELFQASAQQNSSIIETITGIHTIKTAAAELSVRWHWEERFANMVQVRFRGQKLVNNLQLASSLIKHLGTTGILWWGARLTMSGQMTIGQFVAFNMLMVNAINPFLAWIGLWDEWQEILISLERVQDVWSTATEENPQQPLTVLPSIQGVINFVNVSFRYHATDKDNILNNISFTVQPQQTIGILGSSGSGKTTLVNLLTGLHPPTSGQVLIDGYDIRYLSPHSLRSQLGVVSQECLLFSGTIFDNITLYNSQFTWEQAIAAAKLANAHEFIQALPLGYKTLVGKGGVTLSGGQKQKIAIARALIGKPQMLIFDEATSSLDAKSEQDLQRNLKHFNCTKFIVSHRLSSLRHVDYIFVLNRGMLIKQGTHEQLTGINDGYCNLIQ
ncbi:cysteine peptidase family C39 domain-containing protein [Calothrix rhizosoleniae]|uniref:cysteine peptidase family C39 domain-containing protein n=1 Tax=Calothrix rhizosoleniae TaxID=888997 RepID=UPI000B4A229F|nr:cysteine peptidase family C39 domain-containing protein [Calothrix rhizosoleniae]